MATGYTSGKPLEPIKQVANHVDQQSKETGAEEEDRFMMFTRHPNEPTHKAPQATVNPQMPGRCPQATGNKALQRGRTESQGVITTKSALMVKRKGL